jgi:hypothetical protein
VGLLVRECEVPWPEHILVFSMCLVKTVSIVYGLLFQCTLLSPGVADVGPRLAVRNVLRHEEPGVDSLEVFEDLCRVAGQRVPRLPGVRRKEPGNRAADGGAVKVVRGQVPLSQQDRDHRVA